MTKLNNTFEENLELAKSLTASVGERLGNLSKEFDESKHPRGAGGKFGYSQSDAESARTAKTNGQIRDAISHHLRVQENHRAAAAALRAASPVRGEKVANKHDDAAYHHGEAAGVFRAVMSGLYPTSDGRRASAKADAETQRALDAA
jgi:hypothetical protein